MKKYKTSSNPLASVWFGYPQVIHRLSTGCGYLQTYPQVIHTAGPTYPQLIHKLSPSYSHTRHALAPALDFWIFNPSAPFQNVGPVPPIIIIVDFLYSIEFRSWLSMMSALFILWSELTIWTTVSII